MYRPLALGLLAAALRAAPAAAAPLDLALDRLGNPNDPDPAVAQAARQRFALLSSEMGLALTSFLLAPPATTGHSGFAIDLEAGVAPVHSDLVAGQSYWPTSGPAPSRLGLSSFHVRKGLPYSFEIGGRLIYLMQSTMFAAQAEAKWAAIEGFRDAPDLAVRGAYTRLFGQRDWALGVFEADLAVGKKLAVGGVLSVTPYAALRLAWLDAGTGPIAFEPPPGPPAGQAADLENSAAFPTLAMQDHLFVRYTAGARLVTAAGVTAGLEGTWFPGKTLGPSGDYPSYEVKGSFSAAAKIGMEF